MKHSYRRLLLGLLAAGLCAGSPKAVGVAAASQEALFPDVQSTEVTLTVSRPRWVSGTQDLQFDVTYTGLHKAATAWYSLFNCTSHMIGAPVLFPVKWAQKTTITLAAGGDCVASVSIGLHRKTLCPTGA